MPAHKLLRHGDPPLIILIVAQFLCPVKQPVLPRL
jgi:hypothetical protein